jgi:acetyl esterase/lipase
MEPSLPLLKALLPKVPVMGKSALYHTLGLSENSRQVDLRTALVVDVLRSFVLDASEPVSKVQKLSIRDPGIKGTTWVSKVTLLARPDEDDDVRKAVFAAIEGLKDPNDAPGGYREPDLQPVEAEWTGYRAGAAKNEPLPDISEKEKYESMMREVSSPTTVLFFHGGGFYLMDPASHRLPTQKLAKLTKGRCLSVRYRLAPQNPFPAALVDALVSYLNLIYPPAGSLHEAVDPQHVVFSGDSAGGNLSLALLQTILELHRQGRGVFFNGEKRELPLPAGVALSSPWVDVTHSSPSCEKNAAWDYLPAPSKNLKHPSCAAWPTDPPRLHLYAETAMLGHPLVSPLAATSWAGAPPLFIGTGTELMTDEDMTLSAHAARQGVKVVFEHYDGMPHCFPMLLPALPASVRYFEGWAGFVRGVVEEREKVQTRGVRITPRNLEEEELEVVGLVPWAFETARVRVRMRVKEMARAESEPQAKL